MAFNFTVPTGVDFGGGKKIRENQELIIRTQLALKSVAEQLFAEQNDVLMNPQNVNANYLNPNILKLANSIVNNSNELDRLTKSVIDAGISRGVFTHSGESDYVVPSNVDELIMTLITELANNQTLLTFAV